MNGNIYQHLASRTECDQSLARRRYNHPEFTEIQYDAEGKPSPKAADNVLAVRLNHAVIGLTGEVGELAGVIEKWLHYAKPLDKVNMVEEIGDCLWYLALACNALGVQMEAVMESNIAKLKQRYPDRYSSERAAEENRDRAKEAEVIRKTTTHRPLFENANPRS